VKAWQDYREAIEWLRFTWGPLKLFSEGHWQSSATWPYDEERARRELALDELEETIGVANGTRKQ
jgi:hypothetical protein